MQDFNLVSTKNRAKTLTALVGLSGDDLAKAQKNVFKTSLKKCAVDVAALEGQTINALTNEVADIQTWITNQETRGLGAGREAGIKLMAIQELVKVNHEKDSNLPGWQAYCAQENSRQGSGFPSKAQANNYIKLAKFGSSIPATDELGNQWNMKSFIRWSASGCSLQKSDVPLLPVLEFARSQKATKTGPVSTDYLRSIAEEAGHPKLAKVEGTKSGARHTTPEADAPAKPMTMTNTVKGMFRLIQDATMDGTAYSKVSKTDRAALLRFANQVRDHVAALDAVADATPAKKRAKSSK